jgi:hypothetical protein
MIERKRRGEMIHTSEAIFNYQRSLLRGEHVEWTCMVGYKLFFVSAQGKFWICSMVHTDKHIMDVTLDDVYANYRKKFCQEGCGVYCVVNYCVVNASLLVDKPIAVLGKEILARAKRLPSIVSRSSGSQINNSTRGGLANPNGPHKMNGGTEGGPSADEGITLRENA